MMDAAKFDARMMQLALATARRGLGATSPNPAVGAVIANPKTREILARGCTAPGGRPHAEVQALVIAGERAKGATLYVTLEPCAHHGETPPCVEAIIASGIERVVVAIQDPDLRVAGRGLAQLRQAGIRVQSGLEGRSADWLTRGHILRVTEQRPFVALKMAVAGDGSVPRGQQGRPVWVTGALARAVGHRLRAEADVIIVGGTTVRDDNPTLNCRLPGLDSRSPIPVILTTHPADLSDSDLFHGDGAGNIWLAYADGSGHVLHRPGQVEAAGSSMPPQNVDLHDLLHDLAGHGVTRALVEGGPAVWRSFAEKGLCDELHVFVGGGARLMPDDDVRRMVTRSLGRDPGEVCSWRRLADDAYAVFRPGWP